MKLYARPQIDMLYADSIEFAALDPSPLLLPMRSFIVFPLYFVLVVLFGLWGSIQQGESFLSQSIRL